MDIEKARLSDLQISQIIQQDTGKWAVTNKEFLMDCAHVISKAQIQHLLDLGWLPPEEHERLVEVARSAGKANGYKEGLDKIEEVKRIDYTVKLAIYLVETFSNDYADEWESISTVSRLAWLTDASNIQNMLYNLAFGTP